MRHQLKHYEKYVKTIRSYARGMQIKVILEEGDNGASSPTRKYIKVGVDQSETGVIATLLHELGHMHDFTLVRRRSVNALMKYHDLLDKGKIRQVQLRRIVKGEERAWAYGKIIAKMLGIPIGKWYDEHARDAIRTYRNHYAK